MIMTEETLQSGVTDCGAIRSLEVPPDWSLGTYRQEAYGYVISWNPPDNSDVSLNVSYYGHPLAESDALTLQNVLSNEHTLSQSEIRSLRAALREVSSADVFTIKTAVVRCVSSVPILEVSGSYREQPVDITTIRINSSGDGRIVQEISYRAPRDLYERYLPAARAALSSLQIS